MENGTHPSADQVAKLCYEKYSTLSKTGKPIKDREWTLLAGFVVDRGGKTSVVSLATGTKCIGRNAMVPDGSVLNDSHAEVLARRCFLRYIYHQLNRAENGDETENLFRKSNGKYAIRPDVSFHMFTSHVPCGDASIIPKIVNEASNSRENCRRENGDQDAVSCDNVHLYENKRETINEPPSCVNNTKDHALKTDINSAYDTLSKNTSGNKRKYDKLALSLCNNGEGDRKNCGEITNKKLKTVDKVGGEVLALESDMVVPYSESVDKLPLSTSVDGNVSLISCTTASGDVNNKVDNRHETENALENCVVASNQSVVEECVVENVDASIGDGVSFREAGRALEITGGSGGGNDDSIGRIVRDIHRTGAKCLPDDARQDAKGGGAEFHVVGAVRTKPGRGDPTLSVSCSDKIARWVAVGVQGSLLSVLLENRIYLASITIGGGGPFSYDALHRAVIRRTGSGQQPKLMRSGLVFEESRASRGTNAQPCPTSVMWADVPTRPVEVAVQGYRQGRTKKALGLKKCLSVCKRELFKEFLRLTGDTYRRATYRQAKEAAGDYSSDWRSARTKMGAWTEKSGPFCEFTIPEEELTSCVNRLQVK